MVVSRKISLGLKIKHVNIEERHPQNCAHFTFTSVFFFGYDVHISYVNSIAFIWIVSLRSGWETLQVRKQIYVIKNQ